MIERGDGSMQRRLDDGRCPSCSTALDFVAGHDDRTQYACPVCQLRISYFEESDDEQV